MQKIDEEIYDGFNIIERRVVLPRRSDKRNDEGNNVAKQGRLF